MIEQPSTVALCMADSISGTADAGGIHLYVLIWLLQNTQQASSTSTCIVLHEGQSPSAGLWVVHKCQELKRPSSPQPVTGGREIAPRFIELPPID